MPSGRLDSGWFARTIPRFPNNLLWEITNACNLRCLHCESAAGRRLEGELPFEMMMDICDQIIEVGWGGVNITGGEPLLRKGWERLAKKLSDGGVKLALVTNGLLFDDNNAAVASDSGIGTVAVSLDGLKENHDRIRPMPGNVNQNSAFDQAVRALELAKKHDFKTTAITHINLWNYHELQKIFSMLRNMGIDGWQVQLGVPLGRLREVDEPYLLPIDKLIKLENMLADFIRDNEDSGKPPAVFVMHSIGYYGKNELVIRRRGKENKRFFVGCVGGWRALSLTADGLVKPCAILPRDFAVGDLKTESLSEIWDDKERFSYQSDWDERKLEGYCRRCDYRHICRAGCTAMAYGLTGSIYNNPYCIYQRVKLEMEKNENHR